MLVELQWSYYSSKVKRWCGWKYAWNRRYSGSWRLHYMNLENVDGYRTFKFKYGWMMVIKARNTRIKIIRHNEKGKKSDKWKFMWWWVILFIYIYIYTSTVTHYRLKIKKQNTNFIGRYGCFGFTDGHGAAVVKYSPGLWRQSEPTKELKARIGRNNSSRQVFIIISRSSGVPMAANDRSSYAVTVYFERSRIDSSAGSKWRRRSRRDKRNNIQR